MEIIQLSKANRSLRGTIALDGSKSLSNRALIIMALAGANPATWLHGLSQSEDTLSLLQLLQNQTDHYDAGDAGTTFRFLTAYLALLPGVQQLTGSARMRERPIGALVQALRSLGAEISFLGREGYPPLQIGPPKFFHKKMPAIRVDARVSSQFLSALLLIGPYLPAGLQLIPEGKPVSRPYLDMTMKMMQYFGAQVAWQGDTILVPPGQYQARALQIEADWSAASYWYAMAAFAEEVDLTLLGLQRDSWQGDAVVLELMEPFDDPGPSHQGEGGMPSINLKTEKKLDAHFSNRETISAFLGNSNFSGKQSPFPLVGGAGVNFRNCPDLAQTLAVVYAGLGIPAQFSGLETLVIKETDRTQALSTELAKVGVQFGPEKPGSSTYLLRGRASWDKPPRFATYGDHRMAMAFATLAMLGPVEIENPGVVAKSYPAFWEHLAQIGFSVEKTNRP